ncbi:MAG: hypothetical protein ACLP7P_19030 [Rhodomicrobium sp.]
MNEYTIASAAFILFIAAIFSYVLSVFLPKRHYPRFFALLIGLATVPLLAMLKVPGAWEALEALFFSAAFSLWPILLFAIEQSRDWFFKSADTKTAVSTPSAPAPRPRGAVSAFWQLISGLLLGIVVAGSIVSAVIIPPGYLWSWLMSKETLADRIERALKPGETWQTLRTHDRETSEALTRSLADLDNATKRLSELDAQLKTAQDELNKLPQSAARGIQLSEGAGQRSAGGTVYFGVSNAYANIHKCWVNANTDKGEQKSTIMEVGQAIDIASSRGKYRIVLTSVAAKSCSFDLVKD